MALEIDPIGALLAAAALMYPVITGRREGSRKEVSYALNVAWKDSDACEVYIRFSNSGTVPIRRDDHERAFGFTIGESARIEDARILEQIPPDLGVAVDIVSPNTIELTPILLNPGDSFSVMVRLKGYVQAQPQGRVSGIGRIADASPQIPVGQGFLEGQGFVDVVRSLATSPQKFFAGLPRRGNFVKPFLFWLMCFGTNVVISAVLSFSGLVETPFGNVFGLIGAIVGGPVIFVVTAGIFHLFVRLFVGAQNAGFEATFRVACYAYVAHLLGWLPAIGPWIITLVPAYLMYVGTREMHNSRKDGAALAVAVMWLLTFVIGFVAGIAGAE